MSTPEVIPKKRGRKPKPASDDKETYDFLIKFPRDYKEILQELAFAFHKSGVIPKATITDLIRWNTDRVVQDVLRKKREQLAVQLKQEAIRKANIEFHQKLAAAGITPEEIDKMRGGQTWHQ